MTIGRQKIVGSKTFELSDTERKVYIAREAGKGPKEVAEELGLSVRYVNNAYLIAKEKVAVGAVVEG